MKKSNGNDHSDVMRQRQFPTGPGSDLGSTTAIPMGFVPDVDLASRCEGTDVCTCGHCGHHYSWNGNHSGHMGQHTFSVPSKNGEGNGGIY